MASRVTISDVAKKSGVSLMTVSRVINHKEDVNPETRQRILQVIEELDYRPSAIARSLATQQTRTIGLVMPDVSNPFFADITRGIEHLADAQGYHVFLCNTDEDPQRELALIESLEGKRVDGLILCSSRLSESLLVDLLPRLPAVVLINLVLKIDGDDPFPSVINDDQQGGWLATNHLIQRGHSQIGFLAGPANSFSGQRRHQGYLQAMAAAGLSSQAGWTVNCPPTVEGGHLAASSLLHQHPDLTALFCYNDLVAVGALQACNEFSRRVPEDMMIVGYDDIPLAGLVTPTLTTCHVQRRELGALAVEALLECMRDCIEGSKQIVLQPSLVIRQSAP